MKSFIKLLQIAQKREYQFQELCTNTFESINFREKRKYDYFQKKRQLTKRLTKARRFFNCEENNELCLENVVKQNCKSLLNKTTRDT